MVKKIIILGTAGNSIDILETINELHPKYKCIGFLDDDETKLGKRVCGVEVLGKLSAAKKFDEAYFVNGIGNPNNFWKKEQIIAKTHLTNERFETIIHPSATVSKTAKIGKGTVIFQNVTVASRARIGNHVIILANSVLNHDTVVGDYTSIASGVCVSGSVEIRKSCYLGTNSSIIGEARIGEYSLIGMGAVVIADVNPNSVVVGNPAKFLKSIKNEQEGTSDKK
jgi:sugar O-acyltransferase (sialic acid O-acetyltransferase NeuD family)